jgi:pimeloyl-ACP methyl ester carboxylesterase
MPEISASDGARLFYELHGSGATNLILLHGMGGSSASWKLVLAHLDLAKFRVLTLDLRGHGESRGSEMHFTFPQLTADILAIADAAGMREAVVVGLSGSSKNAVHLTLTASERVRGLILVVPPGLGTVPLPRETLHWVFDYISREKKFPPEFDGWFTSRIGPHRGTVEREYAQTPRAVLDASAELWVHTSIAEEATRVTQPVLVIAGACEPIYHPEFQRQTTLATLPLARMEILNCAHFISFEEPRALAESFARFCATLP